MSEHRIYPVFVPHSGCDFRCVFCNQSRITGAGDDPVRAIRRAVEAFDGAVGELAFYGGSFTAIPVREQEHLLMAAGAFLALHPSNTIRVSTRPDCLTPDAVERLVRYGVRTVELGVQSMDREVLLASGRPVAPDCVDPAVALLRRAGMRVILQMMTGLPGDTPEKSRATAEAIIALRPAGVRIYPTVVVAGTPLAEMVQAGTYIPHTVEEAVTLCAALWPLFHRAGIPVIRLGLCPTDALSDGGVLAGPYHPAFGQLVYARIYRALAMEALADHTGCSEVILGVAYGAVSNLVGQRRENVQFLEERLGIGRIRVCEIDVGTFEVAVVFIAD